MDFESMVNAENERLLAAQQSKQDERDAKQRAHQQDVESALPDALQLGRDAVSYLRSREIESVVDVVGVIVIPDPMLPFTAIAPDVRWTFSDPCWVLDLGQRTVVALMADGTFRYAFVGRSATGFNIDTDPPHHRPLSWQFGEDMRAITLAKAAVEARGLKALRGRLGPQFEVTRKLLSGWAESLRTVPPLQERVAKAVAALTQP